MSDRAPSSKPAASLDSPADPQYEGQRFKVGELIYANYVRVTSAAITRVRVHRFPQSDFLVACVALRPVCPGQRQAMVRGQGAQRAEASHRRCPLPVALQRMEGQVDDWRPYRNDDELHTHDEEGKRMMVEAKTKLREEDERLRTERRTPVAAGPEVASDSSSVEAYDSGDDYESDATNESEWGGAGRRSSRTRLSRKPSAALPTVSSRGRPIKLRHFGSIVRVRALPRPASNGPQPSQEARQTEGRQTTST